MSGKAIIIAANPTFGLRGNVEEHIKHADKHGKVFWHLTPPGNRDISWVHPDIKKGYFYISGTDEVVYKFFIEEDTRKISEYKEANLENKVKKYIPPFRQNRWDENANRYALLIKNITRIDTEIPLSEFNVVNTGASAQKVRNYIIVYDREVL